MRRQPLTLISELQHHARSSQRMQSRTTSGDNSPDVRVICYQKHEAQCAYQRHGLAEGLKFYT